MVREAGVPGGTNAALKFTGDSPVVHPGVRPFVRTDAFSLSLRLEPTELQDRAVILHQSRAWTDAGSRGFELTLDHGRPFFGLIHFWPGNAIAVRARRALPLNAWSRLVVTYDGSSRAAGIRMYLDGAPLETDVLRDRLYKDISYRREAGDRSSDTHPLTIGARFRDSGFKNGLIDDLQVFDVCLTAVEVSGSLRRERTDAAAFAHFLSRQHQPYISALAELRALREAGEPAGCRRARDHGDGGDAGAASRLPPRSRRLRRAGRYRAPGHAAEPAAVPEGAAAQSPRPRTLADRPPASAHGPGRRQPHLAHALRPRDRADPGGFRQPGPAADSPGASRLARRQVHGRRVGRQGAAPADRHVRDIQAVVFGVA